MPETSLTHGRLGFRVAGTSEPRGRGSIATLALHESCHPCTTAAVRGRSSDN
jgi:hypothetical protein